MILNKVSRGVAKITPNDLKSLVLLSGFQVNKRNFSIDQIGKRHEKPYDYKKNQYGLWGQFSDSTLQRLGENSLIITVEGNFGAGKSEFAQKLAKEIDFVYAREPDLDLHLYNSPDGKVNRREVINNLAGDNKRFRVDTVEEWHLDPTFKRSISIQHAFYIIRWMQTRTALLHLLSTGQGVVLERSVFSDEIIGQALYDNNFLSEEAFRFYKRDLIPSTITELWRPHLVIYLERSPEDCLKNIKAKGKSYEKQSKVYSLDLLKSVQKNYEKNFLPNIQQEANLLTYTSDNYKTERVVEDLERLDFEDQNKFNDWRIRKEATINIYRRQIADLGYCMDLLKSPSGFIQIPEYLLYGDELAKFQENLEKEESLNPNKGSLFGLWENPERKREWL